MNIPFYLIREFFLTIKLIEKYEENQKNIPIILRKRRIRNIDTIIDYTISNGSSDLHQLLKNRNQVAEKLGLALKKESDFHK